MGQPSKSRWLTLYLGFFENQILLQSLQTIRRNYEVRPEELDGATAAVWYSTRGCETARMTTDETEDWRNHLHQMKQSHLDLIRRWIRSLSRKKEGSRRMRLRMEDAPAFLTVLNDHRLLLAARNDIGQEEMDLGLVDRLNELKPNQQTALLEMDLMGLVMEEVLRALNEGG